MTTQKAILWCAVSTTAQATEDKDSLPAQERQLRDFATAQGWQVVDVLRVPGHSRAYLDIHECARDMQKAGIDAFHKLLSHWEREDFDILAVRDGDRFARTQSLYAYIVERTIQTGAIVHMLHGGRVDEQNFRFSISMGSTMAATEIDTLKRRHRLGMDRRARAGLPSGRHLPRSHQIERDELGNALRVVVNEEARQECADLATLVLEGVGVVQLTQQMHERYGYPITGRNAYYVLLQNPTFWGHIGRHYWRHQGPYRRREGYPVPDGVIMNYNTHEPALPPDLADRVHTELLRRTDMVGARRPASTSMFSGLLICRECGYTMLLTRSGSNRRNRYMQCNSRYRPGRPTCRQTTYIRFEVIQAWLDKALRVAIAAADDSIFQPSDTPALSDPREQIEADVRRVESELRTLILKQAKAGDTVQDMYANIIAETGGRLNTLRGRLNSVEMEHRAHTEQTNRAQHTLDELRSLTIDRFWDLPERKQNQHLRALMGTRRLVVLDGQIIGTAEKATP